ncbi:MAG TPA: hypothetical protein VFO39_18640 [Candidatus Sulfotelmatobacter sp.]|nr:hypothetical protein [Candidatus Sulfotelmatobacter sp.]
MNTLILDAQVTAKRVCPGQADSVATQLSARKIMGKHFFGVEEAIKYFDVDPTNLQLSLFAAIPFGEQLLTSCRDSHILVAYFPISVAEFRDRKYARFPSLNERNSKGAFINEPCYPDWFLLRKAPVPNSTGKTWYEQQACLGKYEVVPPFPLIVYTHIAHHLATGERIFNNLAVRSSDTANGKHIFMVHGEERWAEIAAHYDDTTRHPQIGLASAYALPGAQHVLESLKLTT